MAFRAPFFLKEMVVDRGVVPVWVPRVRVRRVVPDFPDSGDRRAYVSSDEADQSKLALTCRMMGALVAAAFSVETA